MSAHLNESLKTKKKSSWVIPANVVAFAYKCFSSQSLSHTSNGFHKGDVVVTRAARLRGWSHGELLMTVEIFVVEF